MKTCHFNFCVAPMDLVLDKRISLSAKGCYIFLQTNPDIDINLFNEIEELIRFGWIKDEGKLGYILLDNPLNFIDEISQIETKEILPPYLPPREIPKSEFDDLTATDVLLNCDVAKCLDNYFSSNYYSATREQAAIPFGMDIEIFKDWAEAFNTYQISIGNTKKTLKDWAVHFPRWLHKQDISKNPKKLHEYEQGINKKPDTRTGKAATGANVNTDSAIEKLSRMS